jgi:hypothetical protein
MSFDFLVSGWKHFFVDSYAKNVATLLFPVRPLQDFTTVALRKKLNEVSRDPRSNDNRILQSVCLCGFGIQPRMDLPSFFGSTKQERSVPCP